MMEMKNITLRFGGVVAIEDISFDIREGEDSRNYRPKRRWEILDVECHFWILPSSGWRSHGKRRTSP